MPDEFPEPDDLFAPERSPSGRPIYRHEPRFRDEIEPAFGDGALHLPDHPPYRAAHRAGAISLSRITDWCTSTPHVVATKDRPFIT